MGCSVLVLSSAVSSLGGLVFGYELGIISGALLQLQAEFTLSCVQQEAVVSALLVGALLASLGGGWLIDRYGRRNSILLSNVLVLVGSLVVVGGSFPALVGGRATVGFAMCISSMSCCIFVSEMVPPKHRGLLVTLYEAGITVGILAAYGVNYILSDFKEGWKYMFDLAIVPSLVQFVFIWFLPSGAGAPVRQRAGSHGDGGLIQDTEHQEIEDAEPVADRPDSNTQYSLLDLFQRKDNMRTRTALGLGLVVFQQLTGQPNVLFYASTIFHSVGFHSDDSAVLASVGLGAVKVVATLVAMALADRVGRRPLLIGGCSVMAVSLIAIGLLSGRSAPAARRACGAGDHGNGTATLPPLNPGNRSTSDPSLNGGLRLLDQVDAWGLTHPDVTTRGPTHAPDVTTRGPTHAPDVTTRTLTHATDVTSAPDVTGALAPGPGPDGQSGVVNWIILIFMMAVVSAYSVGFGPMTWLILSEIFPAGIRGRAFAFTSCFNWAANLLVTASFLNVIDVIGLSGTFLVYGLMGVMAMAFFYFLLPETKGKSLEQIDRELCLRRSEKRVASFGIVSRRLSSPGYQRVQLVSSAH